MAKNIKMQKSTADHKLAKVATDMIKGKRGRKPLTEEEKNPSARFVRVAGIRLAKILALMKGLRTCANNPSYAYTEEQVDKMISLLKKSMARTEEAYAAKPVAGKVYKAKKLENPLA